MAAERALGASVHLLWAAEKHLRAMQIEEALPLFDEAENAGCHPDACNAGRWTCHMLLGHYERAWQQSDAITARGNPDPHRFWDGQPLEGRRVLIRCLHGLGDSLQFIRYAPLLRTKTAHLAIEAQPSLRALFEANDLADEVFTWGDPEPPWEAQVEVVELPRIFRTTLSSIPACVPYLSAGPAPARDAHNQSRPLRVGLVWSASSYNPARSLPAHIIAELFATEGVQFFSLQAGAEAHRLDPWKRQVPSLFHETHSALDTAKIVTSLDLVITVDTMMAHLAGALCCPVWTLLPYECDWRWMLGRSDTPWYPTMRLIRQQEPANWRTVIEEVKRMLRQLAASRRKS